jgi:hypothetical protein
LHALKDDDRCSGGGRYEPLLLLGIDLGSALTRLLMLLR